MGKSQSNDPKGTPDMETTKEQSIVLFNARSIINKIPELELLTCNSSPDLILITESWANSNITNAEISLKGYNILRTDKPIGRGGGCLVYHKKTIQVTPLGNSLATPGVQSIWAELTSGDKTYTIGLYYNSPNSGQEDRQLMITEIKNVCTKKENVILCGDFNYPGINWTTLHTDNNHNQQFLDCVQDCFLTQLVTEATRGENILDLVLANNTIPIIKLSVDCPLGNSDHNKISFTLVVPQTKCHWKTECLDYRKGHYKDFRKYLAEVDWSPIEIIPNVDDKWNFFKSSLQTGIKRYIPLRRNFKKDKPLWYNRKVQEATKTKRNKWITYRKTARPEDYSKYKIALRISNATIKTEKRKLEEKISSNIKLDPKAFFKYAKQKMKSKEDIITITNSSGMTIKKETEIAKEFNDFFVSTFTTEQLTTIPSPSPTNETQNREVFISEQQVEKMLSTLEPEKSQGPDNMHPRILKALSRHVAKPLAHIFEKSLQTGEVPSDWKLANVTPIHKKGTKTQVTNYRPISLTSQVCRVLEGIIKQEILEDILSHNSLYQTQHGFLPKKSCVTNLLSFLEDVTKNVDGGTPIDTIYLDFTKAFDTVPHKRLLIKMADMNINHTVIKWVQNWLTNRAQRVTIRGAPSEWLPVTSGVPQGSVLGPILFLIYINDIDKGLTSKLLKFADDTKIFRAIKKESDCVELQRDINNIMEWSNKWQMKFNTTKCKVVHIGTKNPNHQYTMDENPLQSSQGEKDLGVTINQDLSFDTHIANAVKKANQILGMIWRTYDDKSMKNILQLYKSLVRPHLEYATQVWRPYKQTQINLIEKVQRRATRMIRGLNRVTYEERLRKCHLLSLEMRRLRTDLIQTFKIMHQIDDLPSDEMFIKSRTTRTRGHSLKIYKQHCRLDVRKHFFSQRIINEWNNLPGAIVNSGTINEFKTKLKPLLEKHRDNIISHRRLPVPFLTASGVDS